MTLFLQDEKARFVRTFDHLQQTYGGTKSGGDQPAPLSIPLYRWKTRSFRLTFGVEMEYQGPSQIIGWDPNEIMATVTFTSPTNETLDERYIRLKHISVGAPPNGTYRAINSLNSRHLPKDIYNRAYSAEITVHTLTLISIFPGGYVVFGAWARLATDKDSWSRNYPPPKPPSSIPLEGWKEEWIMGDAHLFDAS